MQKHSISHEKFMIDVFKSSPEYAESLLTTIMLERADEELQIISARINAALGQKWLNTQIALIQEKHDLD